MAGSFSSITLLNMCFFRIILLAVLLHGCISTKFPSYQECKEGESRTVGCSTCFCMALGWELCTGRCPEPEKQTEPPPPAPVVNRMLAYRQSNLKNRLHESCVYGDTFGEGCNKCYCSPEGTWECTGLCPPPKQNRFDPRPSSVYRALSDDCAVGDTKEKSCTKCVCIAPGKWACTGVCPRKAMASRRKFPVVPDHCVVGDMIDQRCLKCFCVAPGKWVCNGLCPQKKMGLRRKDLIQLMRENARASRYPIAEDVPLIQGNPSHFHVPLPRQAVSSRQLERKYSEDLETDDYDVKHYYTDSEDSDNDSSSDDDGDDESLPIMVGKCVLSNVTVEGCATCACVDGQWQCAGECTQVQQQYTDNDPNCALGDITVAKCSKCYCIAPGRWVCVGTCLHQKSDEPDESKEALAQTHIIVTDDASECVVGKAITATCGICFCIAPGWLGCTGLCHQTESDALQLLKKAKQMEAFAHPDERRVNPACRVGEIIHLDCQECLCTTAGMMSCIRKACLRGRPKPSYNVYQATPVPSEIEVHYKKLGYGSDYCPVGKVIQTTNCNTCTCVLKGVMLCTKDNCEKTMQSSSYKSKLSVKPLFSGPIIEYEAEYYDLDY